ncbi:hypothetical protein CEQ90_06165 [Lewinellaceae bacterium SD302]|nr:hypothetical protein CEQ90_06165 [Lewinellaceae bacterium SD302]
MKSTLYTIAFFSVLFLGCQYSDDDETELLDPDIPVEDLINGAILNLAYQEGEAARLAGVWTSQFNEADRTIPYLLPGFRDPEDFNDLWGLLYTNGYILALRAEQAAAEEESPFQEAVAKILRAHYIAETALMFGDVPFSQVGDILAFPDPVFDGQAEVIERAIDLLEESLAETAGEAITDNNSILTGTATWAQFANALIARYNLALQNFPEALAAAEAAAINSEEAEIKIMHDSIEGSFNLFHAFTSRNRFGVITLEESFLYKTLISDGELSRADDKTNDAARYAYYVDSTSSMEYPNTSNSGFFAAAADYPLVSMPEMKLIIAECAARAGNLDQSVMALNEARGYWDTKFGTGNYLDYVSTDSAVQPDQLLKTILLEKFVSVIGLPTLYDMARTNNLIGSTLNGGNELAQRFLYPQSEENGNENFPGHHSVFDVAPINQ